MFRVLQLYFFRFRIYFPIFARCDTLCDCFAYLPFRKWLKLRKQFQLRRLQIGLKLVSKLRGRCQGCHPSPINKNLLKKNTNWAREGTVARRGEYALPLAIDVKMVLVLDTPIKAALFPVFAGWGFRGFAYSHNSRLAAIGMRIWQRQWEAQRNPAAERQRHPCQMLGPRARPSTKRVRCLCEWDSKGRKAVRGVYWKWKLESNKK